MIRERMKIRTYSWYAEYAKQSSDSRVGMRSIRFSFFLPHAWVCSSNVFLQFLRHIRGQSSCSRNICPMKHWKTKQSILRHLNAGHLETRVNFTIVSIFILNTFQHLEWSKNQFFKLKDLFQMPRPPLIIMKKKQKLKEFKETNKTHVNI
jgi:hypothetical protein